MIRSLLKPNRIPVPSDLAGVTTRDAAAEVAPESVDMRRVQVERIWRSVEDFYRTGLQPAISLTIRRRGRIVLRRSIGHRVLPERGQDPTDQLCTPETPVCQFSASKAVTAMLIHKLAEQKLLRLDERVSHYIPEYGVQGKGTTTVRQLLAHRAGIPRVPKNTPPEAVFDWEGTVQMLCAAKPVDESGDLQSYHAITGGFILGELAQRVSGQTLREVLHDSFAAPMGFKHFTYGMPAAKAKQAALNYHTGPKSYFPIDQYVRRILGASFEKVTEVSNDPRFLAAVIPAGNLYATADEAGAFYQMLLQGGEWNGRRILRQETVVEAIRPYGPIHFDRTLFVPVRFSAGFVLGEWPVGLYGRDCRSAYGHLGFLNILCWADPARDISVGLVNTGKTISADQLLPLAGVLGAISGCCEPVSRTRRTVD